MSRQTTTRVRCVRCFYGYVETTGILEEVDFELERRAWRKDDAGNDICSACVEAEIAQGARRNAIQLVQAQQLLKVNGVEDSAGNAARIIEAQNAVIEAIRGEQSVASKEG